KGQKVPIVGRVSMDMLTVDLSLQPQAEVYDEVMLWGNLLPVEKIAMAADTIPYTLVCGVTTRVPRYSTQG
ncbi:MAG: alanine racemase, partial [Methylococcales bacterium]|nr:alanine racemase [Methylococcales bacterium]